MHLFRVTCLVFRPHLVPRLSVVLMMYNILQNPQLHLLRVVCFVIRLPLAALVLVLMCVKLHQGPPSPLEVCVVISIRLLFAV